MDDLIIAGKRMENIEVLKGQMRKEFEMKDMGMLKYFLGMQVHRDRANRQIFIHQTSYINSILEKFDMANCNPFTTPMATGTVLYKATEKDKVLEDPREYQSLIGLAYVRYALYSTRSRLCSISVVSVQQCTYPNSLSSR